MGNNRTLSIFKVINIHRTAILKAIPCYAQELQARNVCMYVYRRVVYAADFDVLIFFRHGNK